jgi:outer membrane protein assembly factor BamD (BamD/ComL family)
MMGALRLSSVALFLALSTAPYQCAREPDPKRRTEEDPAEVIYNLAERFKADGKTEARAATLKYLVERFPTSRFTKAARAELEEMGQPAPAPSP